MQSALDDDTAAGPEPQTAVRPMTVGEWHAAIAAAVPGERIRDAYQISRLNAQMMIVGIIGGMLITALVLVPFIFCVSYRTWAVMLGVAAAFGILAIGMRIIDRMLGTMDVRLLSLAARSTR